MTTEAAVPAAKATKQAAHAAKNIAQAAEIVGEDAVDLVLTPVKAFNTRQAIIVAGVTIGVVVGIEKYREAKARKAATARAGVSNNTTQPMTAVNGSE